MAKTVLCYFTGTGNSLQVARELGAALGETTCLSMTKAADSPALAEADRLGLICPVYVWGLPNAVARSIRTLDVDPGTYVFCVVTCGGTPGRALFQAARLLKSRRLTLSAGFAVTMPSNYIVWGGAEDEEKQQALFAKAQDRIAEIQATVEAGRTAPLEGSTALRRALLTPVYGLSMAVFPRLDRQFVVGPSCNSCGICQKVCPVGNMQMQEGKPHWQHRCEQCFACLQWCPQEAIQVGEKTVGLARYHHPKVRAQDLM